MTTLIKTQCPNCCLYFDLPIELTPLLNHPDTPMRCAHCQHNFIINEHLVVSANDSFSTSHNPLKSAQGEDNSWLEELLYNLNDDEELRRHKLLSATDKAVDKYYNELSNSAPLAELPILTEKAPNNIASTLPYFQNKTPANSKQQTLWRQDEETRSIAMLLWIAGCLVLVLALFAQYVIFNLNTLLKNPDYAARLETVCTVAACSLPSAHLDAFIITDLSFGTSEIETSNNFTDIQATLENKSTHSQLLPSLKVTLYNDDSILGEFIALPEDYLIGRQQQLAAGYGKPFIFTTAISATQVSKVTIKAIY